MANRKTNPVNTVSQTCQAFRAASKGVPSPPDHMHLREQDWPYWSAITAAKRPDAWRPMDLILAVFLAKDKADLFQLQDELNTEGHIVEGRINQKHKIIETLARRVIAMTRYLQIHSLAIHGPSAEQAKRNQAAVEAAKGHGDGLIPGTVQ